RDDLMTGVQTCALPISARFSYTMYWYADDPTRPPGGRAIATRRDAGTVKDGQRFVIDFGGGKLGAISPNHVLRGVVTVAGGDDRSEERRVGKEGRGGVG